MSVGEFLPILPLSQYFANHQEQGKFSLSCSEIQPLKQNEVLAMADPECRSLWDDLDLGYTSAEGHLLLRREVAKIHGVTEDDVIIEVPHEAIYVAVNTLVPFLKK